MTDKDSKPQKYDEIKAALIARPLDTYKRIADRVGCCEFTVFRVAAIVKTEGVDVAAIAQKIVDKYFAAHPDATCTEAAIALQTTARNIGRFRQKYEIKFDDDEFYSRRVLRPAWYVCEIAKRGCIGVSLPPDEFNVYLDYYNKKKKGLLS